MTAEVFECGHGGIDTTHINKKPDRMIPLDVLRTLEKEGAIRKVHDYFYSTSGCAMTIEKAKAFGNEIAEELKKENVDGVILTST